jgi:hypothetical protein
MLNHVASANFLPLYLYAGQRPIAGQRPLVYLVYIREYYTLWVMFPHLYN